MKNVSQDRYIVSSLAIVCGILIGVGVIGCATSQQQGQSLDDGQQEVQQNAQQGQQSVNAQQSANVESNSLQSNNQGSGGNFIANDSPDTLSTEENSGSEEAVNLENSVGVNNVALEATNPPGVDGVPTASGMNQATALQNPGLNSGIANLASPSGSLGSQNLATTAPNTQIAPSNGSPSNFSDVKGAPVSAAMIQKANDGLGNPHGVVTWVGYDYKRDDKRLDIQIVAEGSPLYKIFKEKNRAGQAELVVRYLNSDLRYKVRRDIDASEFRSPVAYIRMRHDAVFKHTDVVMTLRDDVQPTLVNKGSSLMMTFPIPDRWFAPKGSENPVASAEVVEESSGGGMNVIREEAGSEQSEQMPYVANPGADKFQGVDPSAGAKLIPKDADSKELVPAQDTGASGLEGVPAENFMENRAKDLFHEFSYTINGVAQADFATEIPTTNSAAADLIEDMPIDLTAGANDAGAVQPQQQPAPSTAQPAGTDVIGVESGASNLSSESKKAVKLEFREAPISQIIKMIAAESNINFIISPEAGSKKTSISLRNVSWDVALKAVLESNRLGMQELSNGLVRIDFLESFAKDHEAAERARQATEALVPTKVLVMPLSYLKAADAANMIREMLPKADQNANNIALQRSISRFKVQAEPRSNSIVVEATPNVLNMVKTLLERLDTQTPQVRIQSRLVEFTKQNGDGLGVKWGMPFNLDAGRGLGFGSLPFPNSVNSNFAVDPGGVVTPGGSLAVRLGSINNFLALDLKLRAYETKNLAETLQTQDVVVQDNEEAKMAAGTTDYFATQGGVGNEGGLREVTYQLELKVTPHITADGAVQMKLQITGDSPKEVTVKAETSKTSRLLSTTLLKRSGETAVIGGLYSSEVKYTELGVPLLGRIPLIGSLFRSRDKLNQKKDLLIMVTPTILGASSASAGGAAGSSGVPTIDAGSFGESNSGSSQGSEFSSQNGQQSQLSQPADNTQQSGQSSNVSNQQQEDVL